MIALLVITDGRDDLLDRTIASAERHLHGSITQRFLYDDTGLDRRYDLRRSYGRSATRRQGFDEVFSDRHRRGFTGAIAFAWQWVTVSLMPDVRFVFHLEDDFVFRRPVMLDRMAGVLDRRPYLAQLALRRQPWNAQERVAGGIVEQWPNEYVEMHDDDGNSWLEHRLFFTTNPSLYRVGLCARGWPMVDRSEEEFSRLLFNDPAVRCGFWGTRASGEWVEHIGADRAPAGRGY